MRSRKLIVLFVTIVLIFSSVNLALAAPVDVDEDAPYRQAVERLIFLDILKGYEDGSFRPDNVVTRAELATIVVKLLNLEGAVGFSQNLSLFKDVPFGAWYTGYVNVAASQGIILGYPDGTFQPNKVVTYPEAVTILVRALGYESDDVKGPWPLNYIVKAADLGITDKVLVTNLGANRGDVALMADNTLMATVKAEDEDDEPGTLLEERLKGAEKEYVVVDIPGAEVERDLDEDEVYLLDIEEEEYDVYETTLDVTNLLGMKIKGIVKDDTLISAVPEDNTVLVLFDEEIDEDETDKSKVYYEIDDKEKDFEISDEAVFIYNTKAKKSKYIDDEDVAQASELKLIDWDDDKEADYVFIKLYEEGPYVVTEINYEDKVVAIETGDGDAYGTIDLDEDDLEYVIIKEGKEISLRKVREDDVIYIASTEDYKEILVVRKVVEGRITEIDDDEYYVDGKEYNKHDDAGKLNVGDEGIFFIGRNNDIVKFDVEKISGKIYAWVVGVKKEYDVFDDDDVVGAKIKLGTEKGEVIILDTADEITIDGDEYDEDDNEAINELMAMVNTFVKYDTDKYGEIDIIETLDYDKNNIKAEVDQDKEKIGDYYINADTVIFHVHYDEDEDERLYDFKDAIGFSTLEEEKLNIGVVLDEDSKFNEAQLIVIWDEEVEASSHDPIIAVVDKITHAVNGEGNRVDKLYCYIEGDREIYYAEDDDIITFEIGDIIEIEFNEDGEIDDAEKAVSVSGVVYAKDSTRIKIDDGFDTEIYNLADDVYIYVYDVGEGEIEKGSLFEIKVQSEAVEGSIVDVYIDDDEVEVILIRKEE